MKYNSPPTVANNFAVFPDLHCPCQDDRFINRIIEVADHWNIREAVIAGDLLDLEALSMYVNDVTNLVEHGLDQAEKAIERMLKNFDRIVWIMGNHEERLLRLIGKNQISFERLKRMVTCDERVFFSEYFYCMSKDGKWMTCHPKEFSTTNPLAITSLMCTKYNVNIIAGHMHMIAQGQDLTGDHIGIIAGTCADPEMLGYSALRPNKKPDMEQGAVIIRNGYPWQLTKWTDWKWLTSV